MAVKGNLEGPDCAAKLNVRIEHAWQLLRKGIANVTAGNFQKHHIFKMESKRKRKVPGRVEQGGQAA